MTSAGRLPGINVVRRGLHLLELATSIMVVAVGTNSDALDFPPSVRDNSLRDLRRKDLLPALILSGNWDIFFNYSGRDLTCNIELSKELLCNRSLYIQQV